jgi:hypothetical protein
VPDGPQTTKFSRRRTHSCVRNACWVGAGMEEPFASQASKVLPVGKLAALRVVYSAERSLPASSSPRRLRNTSAGSHRCALAAANTSGGRGTSQAANRWSTCRSGASPALELGGTCPLPAGEAFALTAVHARLTHPVPVRLLNDAGSA